MHVVHGCAVKLHEKMCIYVGLHHSIVCSVFNEPLCRTSPDYLDPNLIQYVHAFHVL